jgi:hypothetical protein
MDADAVGCLVGSAVGRMPGAVLGRFSTSPAGGRSQPLAGNWVGSASTAGSPSPVGRERQGCVGGTKVSVGCCEESALQEQERQPLELKKGISFKPGSIRGR